MERHSLRYAQLPRFLQVSFLVTLKLETSEGRVLETLDVHYMSTIGQVRRFLCSDHNILTARLYLEHDHATVELTNDNLTFGDMGSRP